ncbi:MAG: cation diffusion facilitator family transporter, partial [Sphingomonadales bacterium]
MADPNGGDSAGGARTAILMKRATAASMAVAGTLVIVKVAAWLATGSVAMLSSVIDSLLDVVASFINLVAVHQALIPADAEHRFGHGKAEAVAGLGQSAIITGSAAFLLFQAGERLIHPVEIANSRVGIAVMLFSMVLTLGLVIFQRRVVRATKSIAISADSLHFESDFLMNLGVIVALVLSSNFGFV